MDEGSIKAKVFVEYCEMWGYDRRFFKLREMILERLKDVAIEGRCGRRGAFEISVNDHPIFSKIETGKFPKSSAVIQEIDDICQGKKPMMVTDYEEISCSILWMKQHILNPAESPANVRAFLSEMHCWWSSALKQVRSRPDAECYSDHFELGCGRRWHGV